MHFSQGYVDFNVRKDAAELAEVASVILPAIRVDADTSDMKLRLNFCSADAAVRAFGPHCESRIEIRAAEEVCAVEDATFEVFPIRFVLNVVPAKLIPGNIQTMGPCAGVLIQSENGRSPLVSAACEYDVKYYAAYKADRQLWEIDIANASCFIGGIDYSAELRKTPGK